jgi:cell division septation protein DedD
MRNIRNISKAAAGLFLVWSLTVAIGAAVAAEVIIEIPIDTVVMDRRNGQPGDIHELETVPVPPEAVGLTCPVAAISGNQRSVHPNNDLIAASGSSSVTMLDVERAPLVRTDADGPLTLGNTVTASLRIGEDLVFSGGFVILIVCQTNGGTTVPPTTVPPTTVPPTTVPPTTVPPTTVPPTTVPPTTAPTTTAPTSSTSPASSTTPTTQQTASSSIPSGVPTGLGDDRAERLPVAALTVAALGITALGVLSYRARRRLQD